RRRRRHRRRFFRLGLRRLDGPLDPLHDSRGDLPDECRRKTNHPRASGAIRHWFDDNRWRYIGWWRLVEWHRPLWKDAHHEADLIEDEPEQRAQRRRREFHEMGRRQQMSLGRGL